MTWKIINTATYEEIDGPFEVFPEVYGNVDRTNFTAMEKLATKLNDNFDGYYVVVGDV